MTQITRQQAEKAVEIATAASKDKEVLDSVMARSDLHQDTLRSIIRVAKTHARASARDLELGRFEVARYFALMSLAALVGKDHQLYKRAFAA